MARVHAEIQPALTAEEWEDPDKMFEPDAVYPCRTELGDIDLCCDDSYYHARLSDEQRRALAALCLHEQSFGFHREDVVRHRREAAGIHECGIIDSATLKRADWHMGMADRIEALLPPEEPKPESTTLTGQLHR